MDDYMRAQFLPYEGQLPHVLLRYEHDVVEGMEGISRAKSPPVPQHTLGHGDLQF